MRDEGVRRAVLHLRAEFSVRGAAFHLQSRRTVRARRRLVLLSASRAATDTHMVIPAGGGPPVPTPLPYDGVLKRALSPDVYAEHQAVAIVGSVSLMSPGHQVAPSAFAKPANRQAHGAGFWRCKRSRLGPDDPRSREVDIPRQRRGLYGGNPSKGFGSSLVTRNRAAPFRPPLPANERRLRALFANRFLRLASGDAVSTVVLFAGVLTRREPV